MRKLNSVPKAHLGLFLKEYEWRFNNLNQNTIKTAKQLVAKL